MELIGTITIFGTGMNEDCGSLQTDDGGSYGFNLSNVDDELYNLLTDGGTDVSSIRKVAFTPDKYRTRWGAEKDIARNMHLEKAPENIVEEFKETPSTETDDGWKVLLTADEQISHMASQGVAFGPSDHEAAVRYLEFRNNYFRVRSFRSGFKRTISDRSKAFADLSFTTLAELSDIDAMVRETFLHLTLDIERAAKMELLRKAEEAEGDPYALVEDFLDAEAEKEADAKENGERYNGIDIAKLEESRRKDPYVGGLIDRYSEEGYPLWAFLELISFGNFNYLYMFSAKRFDDYDMEDNFYLLQVVKNLRNACAHGNCILNDLGLTSERQKINRRVLSMVRSLGGVNTNEALQLMNNRKVHQLVTTLYAHSRLCPSEQRSVRKTELDTLVNRFNSQIDAYESGRNTQILRFIRLFGEVVKKLYPEENGTCPPM